MAERILQIHRYGQVHEFAHLSPGDTLTLDGDTLHIRSASQPVLTLVTPVDEASGIQGPQTTEREMVPVEAKPKKAKGAVQK